MKNMKSEPIKILLVEDNPADARLTAEGLKECRVLNELYTVDDGNKAIDFLNKEKEFINIPKPDLILLDLNLPGMDGKEVLNYIKNHNEFKKIPVLIMSSSSAEEDIKETYALQANCYIKKPIEFNDFIEIVKTIDNYWFSIVKLPVK